MKRSRSQDRLDQCRPVMVWSITDSVIDDAAQLEEEFRDIAGAGFGGVAAFVRCSRYSWDDPLAMRAWRRIARLCRGAGMACWIGPDPRFVSHRLIRRSPGLELLLFGNAARADTVPNTAPVEGGRFTVRCALSARHVHTLRDVAVEFSPLGLAGVYAVRTGLTRLRRNDIREITASARIFYNARDRYVEAFGETPAALGEGWSVIAFFHVRTNHVDFSSDDHLKDYEALLAEIKRQGCHPDGVMWDEPGYTCVYGALPYSPALRRAYRRRMSRTIDQDLWKLAFEAADRSEIPVRLAYYRTVQDSVTRAEARLKRAVCSLWGTGTLVGIHDTWHFESADMCDMNHGSLDLWQTVGEKSGGFVDLGAVNLLKDPASPHYANFAAMSVIAASLGKANRRKMAYNNLWTVGDDEGQGWQRQAMEHAVRVMGLFGTRWLAHAYGPVGTIGEERTFLGSPPLPGYPNHSTWPSFPEWNRVLAGELEKMERKLPVSNLLVVYPVETLYALADRRADAVAAEIFALLLELLDNHFHVDVISTSAARNGRWHAGQFSVGNGTYDLVLCPHLAIVERVFYRLLREGGEKVLFTHERPAFFTSGTPVPRAPEGKPTGHSRLFTLLEDLLALRPVEAPRNSWVTMTRVSEGTIVSLAPSRAGTRYAGDVRFGGKSVTLQESDLLQRILFPRSGEARIL